MKRLLSATIVVAAAFLTPIVLAATPVAPSIEKRDLPGVVNYTRVENSSGFGGSLVGFGGATEPSAMSGLAGEGYATVINLRLADEEDVDIAASQKAAETAGVAYIHIPFDPANRTPGVVDQILDTMADPSNQPVYLHCGSATRASAVWMIGRVLKDGWLIEGASREVEAIAKKPDEAITFAEAYITVKTGAATQQSD